jgi:DNA-binding CsgD family transcriptional regulator
MRLRREDQRRITELCQRLGTLVAGDPPALEWALPEIVGLVRAEKGIAFGLKYEEPDLGVDFFFGHRLPARQVGSDLGAFLRARPHGWAAYDPVRPDAKQRNRAVSLLSFLGQRRLEELPLYTELCSRNDMADRDQLRVLVCDGFYLAAWVGGFRREPFTPYERALLQQITPALERRLMLERRLGSEALARRELDAMLEPLGAPAFLVRTGVAVAHANGAGRQLLRVEPELASRLRSADSPPPGFDLTTLASWGLPLHHLAVRRVPAADAAERVAQAAHRWELTRREREVLELVVAGQSNKDIATALLCAEKTVEVHMSSLLRKSGCDNRNALAAAVWSARLPAHVRLP